MIETPLVYICSNRVWIQAVNDSNDYNMSNNYKNNDNDDNNNSDDNNNNNSTGIIFIVDEAWRLPPIKSQATVLLWSSDNVDKSIWH